MGGRPRVERPLRGERRPGAAQSMRQTWTVLHHDGPDSPRGCGSIAGAVGLARTFGPRRLAPAARQAGGRGGPDAVGAPQGALAGHATQSMRQTRTAFQHGGPDHLGLWLNRSAGALRSLACRRCSRTLGSSTRVHRLLPLAFHRLPLFNCLSLTFHCLSLASHCLSLDHPLHVHSLPLPFPDLSLPVPDCSLLHCLYLDCSLPFLGLQLPFPWLPTACL